MLVKKILSVMRKCVFNRFFVFSEATNENKDGFLTYGLWLYWKRSDRIKWSKIMADTLTLTLPKDLSYSIISYLPNIAPTSFETAAISKMKFKN